MRKFIEKFQIESLTIYESFYWTWSLRPGQVSLGSSIISLNREEKELSEVTEKEFKDLERIIKIVENTLMRMYTFDKINYLKLMMVDDQVHIHVIPRYSSQRNFYDIEWLDSSWPGAPRLDGENLPDNILTHMCDDIKSNIVGGKKYKIGYTTGVFDMFHIGHLNLLRNAKSMCDYLIVGVTTDELVSYKNQEAIIPHEERMEIVSHCIFVDEVVTQKSMDKLMAWKEKKFDVMFVGSDWKGTETWNKLEKDFSKVGVDIVYFPYTKGTSSTKLRGIINKRK